MLGRKKTIQNPTVAKHMTAFFSELTAEDRRSSRSVGQAYGAFLYNSRKRELVDEKRFSASAFHIGLGTDAGDLGRLTKRGVLVADSLLLAHDRSFPKHTVAALTRRRYVLEPLSVPGSGDPSALHIQGGTETEISEHVAMHCPDLDGLGRWILDAEPLLSTGLAWYLPTYSWRRESWDVSDICGGSTHEARDVPSALDFLVRNGRVVEEYDTGPVKSQIVRPVLQFDLPFVDGVDLPDFSKLTVHEFASYAGFRGFLRQTFLELDDALNAVESERELIKIGLRIEDEIRGIQAQLSAARRKRAVAVTGAGVGTVGAVLVAVYGPAFQSALTVLGAAGAGGVWGIIQAAADNGRHSLRQDKWYYVWALARKSGRYGF
ncbi:hypothetical protein OHB06_01260 [Streptomyces sp. NBC_01604]|uniref:hypothetical protein n=1 Tax=Streptomyces sp. NBC_01604 TaxID=2975894 RepID=UPI0038681866